MIIFTITFVSVFPFMTYDEEGIRNRLGFFQMLAMNTLFQATFSILFSFNSEKQVCSREINSHLYDLVPYFISKNIIETPFILVTYLIKLFFCFFICGIQSSAGNFFSFLLLTIGLNLTGQSLAYTVGILINDSSMLVNVINVIFFPMVATGGIFISFDSLPVYVHWISYLSPIRYFIEGMVSIDFSGNEEVVNGGGKEVLEKLGYEIGLWESFAFLICVAIGRRRGQCYRICEGWCLLLVF